METSGDEMRRWRPGPDVFYLLSKLCFPNSKTSSDELEVKMFVLYLNISTADAVN